MKPTTLAQRQAARQIARRAGCSPADVRIAALFAGRAMPADVSAARLTSDATRTPLSRASKPTFLEARRASNEIEEGGLDDELRRAAEDAEEEPDVLSNEVAYRAEQRKDGLDCDDIEARRARKKKHLDAGADAEDAKAAVLATDDELHDARVARNNESSDDDSSDDTDTDELGRAELSRSIGDVFRPMPPPKRAA